MSTSVFLEVCNKRTFFFVLQRGKWAKKDFMTQWHIHFTSQIISSFLPCKSTTHNYGWLGQHSQYSNSLQEGQSRDWIPIKTRFFMPIQTSPMAQPVFCDMGTGPFPVVIWPGHAAHHPLLSSTKVRNGSELYLTSPRFACTGTSKNELDLSL